MVQQGFSCNGCGTSCGLLTAANGSFSDGSGSSNYALNSACTWWIAPYEASQITITFTQFRTEKCYDYVDLSQCQDISCKSVQQIARLSGYYSSLQIFTSTTGFMLVNFTSDDFLSYAGFTASWESRTFSPSPSPPTSVSRPAQFDIYMYDVHKHYMSM